MTRTGRLGWALLMVTCGGCVSQARAQEATTGPSRAEDSRGVSSDAERSTVVAVTTTSSSSTTMGTLGLREGIALATRRDPRVAVAQARRRVAEARREEALVGYAPDVLIGAAYTDGFAGSGSNLGLRGMLGSPFFRHYVAGVDASWNLVDLLRTPFAVRATEAGIDATSAEAATAHREVALAVIDLFERVLTAAEMRAVLDAELGARRQQVGALRARVEAGMVAGEQLLQAEAGLADVEAELATARADEHSARTALRALLGDDRALTAELRVEVPAAPTELPEVRMARAWRRQAEGLGTLRHMDWIPRLTVGGSLGYANPLPGTDPGYYAVGAAVVFPLTGAFRDRSRRSAEIASAEVRASEADAVVEQLSVRVAEMDGAIAGLEAALPSAERSESVARAALDAVAVRADAGAVPFVDVETARAAVRRAEMRVRGLRLRIDGLRARRAFITTASRAG